MKLTVTFNDSENAKLVQLAEKLRASKVDVIRDAMAAYWSIAKAMEHGNRAVQVVDRDHHNQPRIELALPRL